MRVLIFGVGGFVGAYLARELQSHEYEVFGSDLHGKNLLGVKCFPADLLNSAAVEQVVNHVQPEAIINLAAISSVGQSWNQPALTMSVNVVGALNILEAARKLLQLPKVMFIGSGEEYVMTDKPMDEDTLLDANNPYGLSKVTQECFAQIYRQQYGMQVYCVRPFNHTGVGQRDSFVLPSFCKQVAAIEKSGKSGVLKVGDLDIQRDFSHVKDIVRAYRLILESEDSTKIYNVGSGKAYSLVELLQYICSLTKQQIRVEQDSERMRAVDNPVICCDSNKIKAELGWQPEYTVYDALDELYVHYLQEK